jgi:hypothetical protein
MNPNLKRVLDAIEELYSDTSISSEDALVYLEEISERVDELIGAL